MIAIVMLVATAAAADTGVNISTSFIGNSTFVNYTIYDMTTSYCPTSTSTIISGNGAAYYCYNQTNVDDTGYMVQATGYTSAGIVHQAGAAWFRRVANPIAGLSPEFALFIALGILMFTALMAGTSTAPAISLCVTFEGWVMYSQNMFVLIDPEPLYQNLESGSTVVPAVLTIMTFITIVWLFVEYRRKGK